VLLTVDASKVTRLRPQTPPHIILTSGRARADDIPGIEGLGAFVPKPYILARVVDLVCRMLDPTGHF
jgi:hypothetical protein